ncbi:hypothetical protein [Blastomonas sp.]|uniref:hypothetical protein n=1 Tax=Blastomonas sp. TaxID=1909299 RepID=UPI00391C0E28
MTDAPPIQAPLMSPGTYLRKRREAAGISLDLAAVAFVPWGRPGDITARIGGEQMTGADFDPAVRAAGIVGDLDLISMVRTISAKLTELEADQRHVDRTITTCLARIVPLDVEIYDALVALHLGVSVPLPQICRECGCSWHRPCVERVESGITGCFAEYGCAWSASDPNLCTACERKAAAPQQETADAS